MVAAMVDDLLVDEVLRPEGVGVLGAVGELGTEAEDGDLAIGVGDRPDLLAAPVEGVEVRLELLVLGRRLLARGVLGDVVRVVRG